MIYDSTTTIVRAHSELYAVPRIQNEFTGQVIIQFRRVYEHPTDCTYYYKADGSNHECTRAVKEFLAQERKDEEARKWYRQTKF